MFVAMGGIKTLAIDIHPESSRGQIKSQQCFLCFLDKELKLNFRSGLEEGKGRSLMTIGLPLTEYTQNSNGINR